MVDKEREKQLAYGYFVKIFTLGRTKLYIIKLYYYIDDDKNNNDNKVSSSLLKLLKTVANSV